MAVDQAVETRELLVRAQAGDADALVHLIDRYYAQVVQLIEMRLGRIPEAHDVAQDVFIEVVTNITQCRGEFRAWLLFKARSETSDWIRKKQRERAVFRGGGRADDDDEAANDLDEPSDASLEESVLRSIDVDQVYAVLDGMKASHREVLVLFDDFGMTEREVAQVLGLALAATRSLKLRARRSFRQQYDQRYG